MGEIKMEIKEIQTRIEKISRKTLPKGEFVKVRVKEYEDREGEEVLDVVIILEGKRKFDAKKSIKLSRLVRDELVESDEERFPMFQFVIKEEAGELGIAIP
ncbi:MAG: hypothetical protein OXE98_06795 [Hyphomicrobiales bacterium]|nr:hypothetical protein [Hyphomicrobiales bacterium]